MGPLWGGWRDSPDLAGGGLLADAGVTTSSTWPSTCSARSARFARCWTCPESKGETFAGVILVFESGARGLIEANQHGPPGTFDDEIEITGSDATLRLAGLESLFVGYRGGPALSMFRDRQWQEVPVRPDDWTASVQASVMAYLDAVTAGREPPVTGAVALETVRLLERIYDTAADARPGLPGELGMMD